AMVYCTGRSVKGTPSPYGRPETINETAAMITAAGETAVPVQVDHTIEPEVEALFERILREQGRGRGGQQHRGRGSPDGPVGALLENRLHEQRGDSASGAGLAHDHGQARRARHAAEAARADRRG